jgi:immune inhibitor A
MVDQPARIGTGTLVAGSKRLLTILVRFADNDSSVAGSYFDSLLFGHTPQTVWDYYDEISYGTLSVDAPDLPSEIGWRTAPQNYSYYVNGSYGTGSYPHNSQKLVEDLIALIDADVDFSQFDGDNNGSVDGIVVIHAGTGAERSGSADDMWSHMWSIWPPQTRDGKTIRTYSVQPEFWAAPGDMTIGVFCHELGHLLFGLPDLYDYDDDSHGLGLWSLMASGSWGGPLYEGNYPTHPDAWSRIQMGLVTPTTVATAVDNQAIPAIENTATAFKLWTDGGPMGDEYFLAENRQKTGYDAYLPGSGLCIYHIDENVVTDNDRQWYPSYTANGHYLVALEQADGTWDLERNVLYNYGDAGDPYPGSSVNRLFTAASVPSSAAYDGAATYVVIADIANSGPAMTADFNVTIGSDIVGEEDNGVPGTFTLGQNYPNPFNASTRFDFTVPRAGNVDVELFNILGKKVRTVCTGHRESGTHTVVWDGADDYGRPAPGGVYFYRVSSAGEAKTNKMVLLK